MKREQKEVPYVEKTSLLMYFSTNVFTEAARPKVFY